MASNVPAVPPTDAEPAPPHTPHPAGARAERLPGGGQSGRGQGRSLLSQAFAATGSESPATAGALVPWVCDVLPSNHLVKAYPAETLQGIATWR